MDLGFEEKERGYSQEFLNYLIETERWLRHG
jgi:hypothetical protein